MRSSKAFLISDRARLRPLFVDELSLRRSVIILNCQRRPFNSFNRGQAVEELAVDAVFDTVFSVKGTHVISVGRDRTAKLTEYATQRFIDNVTSITPGALKGGIAAIDRHPVGIGKDHMGLGVDDGKCP